MVALAIGRERWHHRDRGTFTLAVQNYSDRERLTPFGGSSRCGTGRDVARKRKEAVTKTYREGALG